MPSDLGYRVVNIRQFNQRLRFNARFSNGRSDVRVAELVGYRWEKNKSFEIIFAYNWQGAIGGNMLRVAGPP